MTIEEARQRIEQYTTQLETAMATATSADSPGGTLVTQEEQNTINAISTRLQQWRDELTRLQTEQGDQNGTTSDRAISYGEMRNRTWRWRLEDEDTFTANDFGAALEINCTFGKVERAGQTYWVLDGVMASPQSTTGLKMEVSSMSSRYYSVGGKLTFTINIQFKLSTADVSVSTTTGIGGTLGASDKQTIGLALPVEGVDVSAGSERGVNAGLNLSKQWTESQNLPGSATTVSRIFTCTNDNGRLTIVKTYGNDVEPSGIDDPGMDVVGGADWVITHNDSNFAGSL